MFYILLFFWEKNCILKIFLQIAHYNLEKWVYKLLRYIYFFKDKRINNNELVEANSTIGKLITSEEWSIVIPIDEEKAVELEEESYVEVKFIKTQ